MANWIFDTSYLIRHWKSYPAPDQRTAEKMRLWAERLVEQFGSRRIVTPVVIEMVAGARSSHELDLTQAYLEPFHIADEGRIPKEDWDKAKRLAQRVPQNGKNRDLGDCLIRAIADRLNCDVLTFDGTFPGR